MTTWEYKVEEVSSDQVENQLNFMGEQGWELISIEKPDSNNMLRAIFKKPRKTKPTEGSWFS